MGLDMYLEIRKQESLGRWDDDFEARKDNFYPEEFKELEAEIAEHNFLSRELTVQVGYWRKANAIHNWFVHNCGDDVDECQPIYVSVEKAAELLNLCKQVRDDHSKAEALLPTRGGFFFGSIGYDEWYFKDIDYTINLLEKVIKFMEAQDNNINTYYELVYQASW